MSYQGDSYIYKSISHIGWPENHWSRKERNSKGLPRLSLAPDRRDRLTDLTALLRVNNIGTSESEE